MLAAIAKDVHDIGLQVSSTVTLTGEGSVPAKSAPVSSVSVNGPPSSLAAQSKSLSTGGDWAAIASTPHVHGSRFTVLTTDDDGDPADGRPFTVVDRRRSAKRARQQSSPSQRPSQRPQQSTRSQREPQQPPAGRGGTVYGVASSNRGTNIAAAKITRKKAVFCLDNIAKTCSVHDVRDYASRLSIQVLTCFEVKSRRRRDDTDDEAVSDRTAFRLCIYDDDREKLLNPNAWPNSVAISPWYFKNPGVRGTDNLPRVRDSFSDDVAAGAGAATVHPAARRPPCSTTSNTVQPVGAVAATVPSPEVFRDESAMSNDETILTPINADNDGN